MLATLVVASGCAATRVPAVAPGLASRPATASEVSSAAWVAQARSLQGANQWLLAGEAASRNLPRTDPTVLFVGDSITQWWTRYGAATWRKDFAPLGAVDDGVVGDTTSNVLYRLESGSLAGIHPRVVVILIGTNNIALGNIALGNIALGNIALGQTPAEIGRGILAVVSVVRAQLPGARILLLGLLPRGQPGSPERIAVAAVNRVLAASVPFGSGAGTPFGHGAGIPHDVTYLDLGAALLRSPGAPVAAQFRPGAMHSDLLHPAAGGYAMLGARLEPAVKALLTAPD